MQQNIWSLRTKIFQKNPLVLNLTNYVVMNNSANALLAVGASPIMAHAKEEMAEMVAISDCIVVNIGTLDSFFLEGVYEVLEQVKAQGKRWIFDPVGVGASQFRKDAAQKILEYNPTAIRGNASEILALCDLSSKVQTKGVDSLNSSIEVLASAHNLAVERQSVVAISGETDFVLDGTQSYSIYNGDPMMPYVTGLGCSETAVIGAFLGLGEDVFQSVLAGMSVFALSGQLAAKLASGPATLQVELINKLYNLSESEYSSHLEIHLNGQS